MSTGIGCRGDVFMARCGDTAPVTCVRGERKHAGPGAGAGTGKTQGSRFGGREENM